MSIRLASFDKGYRPPMDVVILTLAAVLIIGVANAWFMRDD